MSNLIAKIARLKIAFQAMKEKTKLDHSEWIQADNLDEIRVIQIDDHLDPKKESPLMVENEHGTEFGLDQLSEDELDVLIFSLEN